MSHPPRRRRSRTVFHYKVDEALAPADRPAYLALLHDPRTRNEDAHRWLTDHGYTLSLSAVARHRRRLLAAEAERQAAERKALVVARLAAATGGADLAGGALLQFQYTVFEHVLRAAGDTALTDPPPDGAPDPNPSPEAESPAQNADSLLKLSKLLAASVALSRQHADAVHARRTQEQPPSPPAPLTPEEQAARDAALRLRIEEILDHRG